MPLPFVVCVCVRVRVYRLLEQEEPVARKRQVQDVLLCIAIRKKSIARGQETKSRTKGRDDRVAIDN